MQYILSVIPGEVTTLPPRVLPAHMAYRIGPDSTLLRRDLPLQTRSGLLAFTDRDAPQINDPQALCDAVLRECNRRSYQGVLSDLEPPLRRDLLQFARLLAPLLHSSKRPLFLPESYARQVTRSSPIICTALSGGDLTERLKQALADFPQSRPALDVQRLRMDFPLPARTGEGRALTAQELHTLLEERRPSVFFSPALCTRYFTYMQNGVAHFVLYDDAETLHRKVRIGESLGFGTAIFQWPEICDIADDLFRCL